MQICSKCKLSKDSTEYYKYNKWTCKECLKEYHRAHSKQEVKKHPEKYHQERINYRTKRRLLIYEYLLTHPCVDCGNTDIRVLEFDHITGEKDGKISRMIIEKSWKCVQKEIEKCEVRCANCHRIRHAVQQNSLANQFHKGPIV